jgi:hypothetical protein
MVKVLEVIDDDKLKFEVKECGTNYKWTS